VKIAVVTPYPASGELPSGGVEVAARRLVSALSRRGTDVTVVDVHGAGNDRSGGVPIVRIGTPRRWSLARDLRPMRKALARVLPSIDADIVHAEGLVPAGYASIRGSPSGVPNVVTAHGSRREDTMAAYAGVPAQARWLLGRRMTLRTVTSADAVIGVHPEWRVNLPSRPRRFVYIPNLVEERFFVTRRTPEAGRVLYCGGATRIKGWDILLKAWALVIRQIPGAQLHAVGCANAKGEVPDALMASIDIDTWLAPAALADALARAELIVIPSRFEVAPTVLVEAWASKTPVVANAVGGIATIAAGAADLADSPCPTLLADAIVRSLTDKGSVEPRVREGYERAQRHREDHVIAAHLDLYASLLGR
jgi:glycosyltransferase involved in cell wall biosynthesis